MGNFVVIRVRENRRKFLIILITPITLLSFAMTRRVREKRAHIYIAKCTQKYQRFNGETFSNKILST